MKEENFYLGPSERELLISEIVNRIEPLLEKLILKQGNSLENDLMTTIEVEKLLKISHTTRIDWSERGILKRYPLSGRVYYRRSDIEAALIPMEERNPRRAA